LFSKWVRTIQLGRSCFRAWLRQSIEALSLVLKNGGWPRSFQASKTQMRVPPVPRTWGPGIPPISTGQSPNLDQSRKTPQGQGNGKLRKAADSEPSCPTNLSSKHFPALNVSPLSSVPSAASPYADYFPECANMSLRGAFSQRIRSVVSGSIAHTRLHKFHVFRNLASTFLKTKVLTVEPSVQPIENRQLAPNTPGGMGGYPQYPCIAHPQPGGV